MKKFINNIKMQYLFKKSRQMKSLRKLKSNIEIKSYLLHHSEAKKK